jgi:ADP-ribose pyrophosphatase YjhB (NUDIX family)
MSAARSGASKWVAMHMVSPRTLLFLQRDGRWLFLRGAARKWFAGQLNGLGGHVEAGEGVLDSARREALEETGLAPVAMRLAAVVHTIEDPPCILFVVVGTLPEGDLVPTDEGEHVWLTPTEALDPTRGVLADVRALLPQVTSTTSPSPALSFTLIPPADLRRDGA